jgi:integrase
MEQTSDDHGAVQADKVLSLLRSVMAWLEERDDDFVSRIPRGLTADVRDPKDKKRKRLLADDELRALWSETKEATLFNRLVRFLLASAQRYDRVANLKDGDIVEGVWTLAKIERAKNTIGEVRLSKLALATLADTPRHMLPSGALSPFIFANSRGRPFNDPDRNRRRLHKRMEEQLGRQIEPFVLHDLRAQARSLMSRAQVPREHAERVLGHTIGSTVEGVYDRHSYYTEKSAALEALAAMLMSIVEPPPSNVIEFPAKTSEPEPVERAVHA